MGHEPQQRRTAGRSVRRDRTRDQPQRPLLAPRRAASFDLTNLPLHVGFGRAVRSVRSERDLSQEALGYRAGLHRNYVSLIERGKRGKRGPTLGTVEALADALAVMPSALIAQAEREAGWYPPKPS
jgi:ribosome-binding protein aMBF1 (putative translation factor)